MFYINKAVINGQEVQVNSLEGLQDASEHNRFIEGNSTLVGTITGTNFNTYNKWSLSGSHLMIVVAYTCTVEYPTIAEGQIFKVNLPDWIKNKIYPIKSDVVSVADLVCIGNGDVTKYPLILRKTSGDIYITTPTALNFNDNAWANGRVQFDLLIDND